MGQSVKKRTDSRPGHGEHQEAGISRSFKASDQTVLAMLQIVAAFRDLQENVADVVEEDRDESRSVIPEKRTQMEIKSRDPLMSACQERRTWLTRRHRARLW